MKNAVFSAFCLFVLFMVQQPLIAQEHQREHMSMQKESVSSTKQVLVGEVLDMVCFMAHNSQGKKHKDCAQKCIKEGAPVGLLTSDGKVYLAIENHRKKEPFKKLKGLAAEKVKITGTVYVKNGVQSIEVEDVEKM